MTLVMGYEKVRFENQNLDSALFCLICENVLKAPRMCSDEHICCDECWNSYMEEFGTCPGRNRECGATLESLKDAPRVVKRLLDKLKIRCANQKCTEITLLKDADAHSATCPLKSNTQPAKKVDFVKFHTTRLNECVDRQVEEHDLVDGFRASIQAKLASAGPNAENLSKMMQETRETIRNSMTSVSYALINKLKTDLFAANRENVKISTLKKQLEVKNKEVSQLQDELEKLQMEVKKNNLNVIGDRPIPRKSMSTDDNENELTTLDFGCGPPSVSTEHREVTTRLKSQGVIKSKLISDLISRIDTKVFFTSANNFENVKQSCKILESIAKPLRRRKGGRVLLTDCGPFIAICVAILIGDQGTVFCPYYSTSDLYKSGYSNLKTKRLRYVPGAPDDLLTRGHPGGAPYDFILTSTFSHVLRQQLNVNGIAIDLYSGNVLT